ncbi:MAG: glycosyltransferase, partial [Desulfotomaculaceae bacterium]|nr:glycosyltransferase [Desulfotomaculaceae bacterium]
MKERLESSMFKVAMYVINNFTNDARVRREAATMANKGYQVTVIALKDSETPAEEVIDNYRVKRVRTYTRSLPRVPGFQILKYLEFIIRAVLISLRLRVDICHAHDLNALVPAYIASRLLKAYLIYDSHELATQRNIPRRRLWGEMTLWRCLEKFLIR